MDHSPIHQEMAVAVHEVGGGEALTRILHLRVAEGEPDLLHLILPEETIDNLDICAQESHVLESFVQGLCSTGPHAGALDIHTHEVHLRVELGQLHGILTLAASQLQYDGVVIVEILFIPVTFHLERDVGHHPIGVLKDILVSLHIGKLR